MSQVLSFPHKSKTQLLCVLLSFFICFLNSSAVSAEVVLPEQDVALNASVGFGGVGGAFKFKHGFYYGSNKLFHINYQHISSDDSDTGFSRNTFGLGYRQLTTRYGIIGGYAMLCRDHAVITEGVTTIKRDDSIDGIVGGEILTSRYHNVINIHIPLDPMYDQAVKDIDIRHGNVSADISIKFVNAFMAKKWIPTVGGYLVQNSKKNDAHLFYFGLFVKVDYVLFKNWAFNFKIANTFGSEEDMKCTIGFGYQSYNPATYTAYGDSSGVSRLLHMPLQHSEVSRFSTP